MANRRIATSLIIVYAAFITALAGFAVLTLLGIAAVQDQIGIAGQSLRQLETARILEAAFNRFLLDLDRGVPEAAGDAGSGSAAGRLRGTLLVHRGIIGEEIAAAPSVAEADAERAEMVRALRLATLFEDIERKVIFARARQAENGRALTAAGVAGLVAVEERAFREILDRIIEDEQQEVAAALAGLEDLRRRYLVLGLALAGGSLSVALALGAAAYGRVLRPINALTRAVEAYPADATGRAPANLPGEFAVLADRFNRMLGRIETEQERLKEDVDARTADLARANAELTGIDAARRAFFANISHELRTPVTVLLGEAQVALRGQGGEREALERIAANGGYLRRRLDDLLSLARSEDGTLALERKPFQLAAAAEQAVGSARSFAAANEARIDFERDGDRALVGDASAMRQAVLALIDNAVKFSPPDGLIRVRVTAGAVSVSDEGPGFGGGDPMAMFDRYAQGGAGRGAGGAGLGLAIVRWIAEHHGAAVVAANRKNGGATVRLSWPT